MVSPAEVWWSWAWRSLWAPSNLKYSMILKPLVQLKTHKTQMLPGRNAIPNKWRCTTVARVSISFLPVCPAQGNFAEQIIRMSSKCKHMKTWLDTWVLCLRKGHFNVSRVLRKYTNSAFVWKSHFIHHHVYFTHSGYTTMAQHGQHHPKFNHHIHMSCLDLVCVLLIYIFNTLWWQKWIRFRWRLQVPFSFTPA